MATDDDSMRQEEAADEPGGDIEASQRTSHVDGRSTQTVPARAQKLANCAFCRRDHKKCIRKSENEKCVRCANLNYSCFGGLETALAGGSKRSLNRNKCDYCRDAKQKCVPEDRVWPDMCERCIQKNLTCSESGSARKRLRANKSPSTGAHISEADMNHYSQSAQCIVTNEATPPQNPQPSSLHLQTHQTLSMVDTSSLQVATGGASDDTNLAMLSEAAATYQTGRSIPSMSTDARDNHEHNGLTYERVMARDRWNQALDKIRWAIRARKIASIFRFAPQPDGIALCNVCVSLELSRENFVIDVKDRYNRPKRDRISLLSLQNRLWLAGKDLKPLPFPLEEINLGNLGTIQKRGHICSFCHLVWNSAQDQVESSEIADIKEMVAFATWQVDGRQLVPRGSGKLSSTKPRNRRIRLHWRKEPSQNFNRSGTVLNDAFVILVADSNRSWDSSFLGRRIEIDKSIITIAKDWVENCQIYHPHSNDMISVNTISVRENDFWEAVGPDFKLVDVWHMRTVSFEGATPQYVALSYTWLGEKNPYFSVAGIERFEQLGEKGGVERLLPQLPRTIRDAITLVKALEFRYLWVDALCTIYDASARKHRGTITHKIAQIFSSAFLTICAADDQGPDAGLVALHTPRNPAIQHIKRCGPGLELMVLHSAETYINQSPWNKRGWTFQERFLSERCLIFAAERVFWECRDATASEDVVEYSRGPCWSLDTLYNPLHSIGDLHGPTPALRAALRAYMQCVEAYTLREFFRSEDILLGFMGVGELIETSLRTDLLYGLPSSFLDFALLWEFKSAHGVSQRHQSPDVRKYPSWSWCGWETAVTYRPSTISGIMSNITDWIIKRTWISWYVRDRYNIPRLLYKFGQEPIPFQMPSKLDSSTVTLKVEDRQISDGVRAMQMPMQTSQQQPVKWPAQNRSLFFKAVPNLEFDTMDVDNENPEDFERRDTKYLQFWTWSGFFRLREWPPERSSNLAPGLSRFGILDNNDDFCGSVVLDALVLEDPVDAVYEMIAISEAKDFTPEEFHGWTYYITKERDESEWDLWYVLIVEKIDDVVVRKMGVGKIFQEAFENSCSPGKEWKEFIMA